MKIPNSVIYVVGEVLGNWYHSHTKLDTLFGGNDFPGDPPTGNCIWKCQEWFRIANRAPDVDPLEMLGNVLVEFMNLDCGDVPAWQDGFRRVTEVLAKNGFVFERNGNIAPLPTVIPPEPPSLVTNITQDTPADTRSPMTLAPISKSNIHAMPGITVFISYSHDSDLHRERVLALSERLRVDGIATILDRYVEKGSPPEGWPRWMMNGLNAATHVLCVCTDTYHRRFLGQEVPGQGKGVDWEGALVTQALYESRSHTSKFVPVLFDRGDELRIPDPLRGYTHYVLDSEASYQALYDALLDQSGIEPGAVGELKRKPRAAGQPLSFAGDPAVPAPAAPPASDGALKIWREKLEFLLVEDAVCVDPAMKFRLKHLINEAHIRIQSL